MRRTKSAWLQSGYKKFADEMDSAECVDYLAKKRIKSAFYHEVIRSEARVGMISETRKSLI